MRSYYLRESDVAAVDRDDLTALWNDDHIAIHYPGDGPVDQQSLNPGDYRTRNEKNAIRAFARIAREGGYVWCQCPGADHDIVGKVEPGSKVRFVDARWATERPEREGVAGRRPGDPAVLKALPLAQAKRIGHDELLGLRASRPRKAYLTEWQACGNRLQAFVEDKLLTVEWRELSRELQETACAEFLRHHDNERLPRMKFLLMPVGRTLQDLDIEGMTEDGKTVIAQVATTKPDFIQHTGKLGPLVQRREAHPDDVLVYFGDVPTITEREGIWVVPTAEVFEFLWKNPEYLHRLFLF